ncbi:hypothetical protein HME9302_00318 [Alteripontixanthobacter maritimus]|uniref:Flagellar protein FliL n=1 Tax=Alteripontixanthobacter maritimus TaxID=2161824 RepID=A0A369Q2K6_9SPHN|nr:flagellar basal body-associated FliL family protein [Alteripontixanthobacter maritimus]RDC59133.1 hypothetical protein HME9302_00318 [Alteripontixanthobacter maritimus]
MTSPATDTAVPKKKSKLKPLLLGAVLLAMGAGGAAGAMHMGYIGSASADDGPDTPHLVLKGSEDPYFPEGTDKEQSEAVDGEGGSKYRTVYYNFEEGFTSNLKDSSGLVQVSLAASTRHDGRVLQWLDRHELAVRSAMLVELANTSEDDAYSVSGKAKLQKRLAEATNRVLTEREGFGGVDAIYFRSYLVQ